MRGRAKRRPAALKTRDGQTPLRPGHAALTAFQHADWYGTYLPTWKTEVVLLIVTDSPLLACEPPTVASDGASARPVCDGCDWLKTHWATASHVHELCRTRAAHSEAALSRRP